MIITSHDIGSTFRMADHVILLLDGGCVSAAPAELRTSTDPRVVAFLAEETPDVSPEYATMRAAGAGSEGTSR